MRVRRCVDHEQMDEYIYACKRFSTNAKYFQAKYQEEEVNTWESLGIEVGSDMSVIPARQRRQKKTDCCRSFQTTEYNIRKLEKITSERRITKLYYNDVNGTGVLLAFVIGPVFDIVCSCKIVKFPKAAAVFDIYVRIWKINHKNFLLCIL